MSPAKSTEPTTFDLPKCIADAKIVGYSPVVELGLAEVEALVQHYGEFKKVKGEQVLVKVKGNRIPKPGKLKSLEDVFLAGEHTRTGQGFIFSKTRFLDGQNRLIAMHRALKKNPKLKFTVDLSLGVKDEAFAKIDGGTPRTHADTIFTAAHLAGEHRGLFETQAKDIGALSRAIYIRSHGYELNASPDWPKHRVVPFILNRHPMAVDCLSDIYALIDESAEYKERLKLAPTFYWALLLYLASHNVNDETDTIERDDEAYTKTLTFIKLYAANVESESDIGNEEATGARAVHPVGRLHKKLVDGARGDAILKAHIRFAIMVAAYNWWLDDPEGNEKNTLTIKTDSLSDYRLPSNLDLNAEMYEDKYGDKSTEEDDAEESETTEETPAGESAEEEESVPVRRRPAKKKTKGKSKAK